MRQHKAQRMDDVRGNPPQRLALGQAFTNQGEFVMLEIAQPAMNQLGRCRRSMRCQIVLVAQDDGQSASGRITLAGDDVTARRRT